MARQNPSDFGTWRVQKAQDALPVAAGAVVRIRLLPTSLLIANLAGEHIGLWPAHAVTVEQLGSTLARIYLGRGRLELEVRSLEDRSPSDLCTAVIGRARPARPGPVDSLERELAAASGKWTATAVLRQYPNNALGQQQLAREVKIFGHHAYAPFTQSLVGGHVHAGRLLLTGGLSVFAGKKGIRSDGTIAVTFQRAATALAKATPVDAATSQVRPVSETKVCPQCAEEVKAAALICRFCRYEFGPLPPPGFAG